MNFRTLFLVSMAALATAVPGSATAPTAIATDAAPVHVPVLARNNHILVRALVNESDSLWFILDSGASGSVINQSTAKRLGLTVHPGAGAHGAGGHVEGGTVEGAKLHIGGHTIDDEPLVAIDLDKLARATGHPCDGIIGEPFWERFVVTIDYARSELLLHDPKTWQTPARGAELPLTFHDNLPYVRARATLPGAKPVEGRYLLDTGSVGSIIFDPGFVEKQHALERVARTLTIQYGGVGGRSSAPLGRIERIELGPYAIEGPLAVLRGTGSGRTSAEDTDGNIGGEILRRFRVTFDYSRKRLHLEPSAAFKEPFEADMSGLVFAPNDDSTHAVEVKIVQPGSPAADLGIQPGDVIETIDGRPVANSELTDLRKTLRQEGRTVRFGLRRDDTVTERTLVTRRLI